ncbi:MULTISPECIES: hypothetical protein [unclassified Endozoicomonas]|uniref:hypothetical protein n=1 Tax=unclassified Endozoicomonas TaxID=2644528 RepID=UPI003BB6B4F6
MDKDENLAPAALIGSPMYRQGMPLQPWQQGFISQCLSHYQAYGRPSPAYRL